MCFCCLGVTKVEKYNNKEDIKLLKSRLPTVPEGLFILEVRVHYKFSADQASNLKEGSEDMMLFRPWEARDYPSHPGQFWGPLDVLYSVQYSGAMWY